jgi:TetR/AcrR family transcriptional regulator, tetracycline repressor protein
VLVAAREMLAEGGIEAMTMRALARRLDVAPNALYSHVANKTDLLDALLDDLLAAVPVPEPGSRDPIAALADLMTATYAVLTAHPNLVPLYLARQGARGPHAVQLGAVMDALLSGAGVSPVNATEARRVLIVHTIGFAAFAGAPTEPDTRPLSFDSSQRTFDRSLRWLLAGITQTAGDIEPNQQSRRPQE